MNAASIRTLFCVLPAILLLSCAGTERTPPDVSGEQVAAPDGSPGIKPSKSSKPRPRVPLQSRGPAPRSEIVEGKRRVLFLGDSFSIGAFGRTFDQTLRDAGFAVYTSVSGGGTPYYWLSDYPPVSISIAYWERTPHSQRRLSSISPVPKVETLLERWDPHIVVVQTGTNLYSTLRSEKRSKEANVRELENLIGKMCRTVSAGGRKCFWITPPDAHPGRYPRELQYEMLYLMQRTAGRYGRVFNSYAVTEFKGSYPGSDGIHHGPSDARRWGQSAARDFLATH